MLYSEEQIHNFNSPFQIAKKFPKMWVAKEKLMGNLQVSVSKR
jgi:hypothetical protein